jgi:hypothetical protein
MAVTIETFDKFFLKNIISPVMMVFFVNFLENMNQLKLDGYKAINYQVAEVGKFMYMESPAIDDLV